MCTGGVNYTQFKLAIHQLAAMEETLVQGASQWQSVMDQLGIKEISDMLSLAAENAKQAQEFMAKAGEVADRLSSSDDSITITPL